MKLSDRFRPKADLDLLYQFNEAAWKARNDALLAALVQIEAGEIMAAHLEGLYPPSDMAALQRYGCVRELKDVTAHVKATNHDRWDEWVSLPLPHPVLVPTSHMGLYCGGEWFSDSPTWGLKPETIERIKAGTHDSIKSWEEYVEKTQESERRRIPRQLEPLLVQIADAKKQFAAQYRALLDMPKIWKTDRGEYPTWSEIAGHFPVAGEEIRKAAVQIPSNPAETLRAA